ncbi:hypothetical protein BHR79_06085 [Methanohalophilus halophilus]|uniref:Uncharacterized protein n=2 Tax=Methanohalophilus halophilus TaxID=2177 RepID=A0A1L3Q2L3_9EURY|nr:hypothetical protein [Methanohalophilus halophilus]APH39095.1 hypothetical protein BHR79_06085 [Methanohalophilus halophilus]RNI09849.1 hypothetical protein EFE40_04170 [Methanohalophilus halophilus]SDW93379.1 hypothetical protein SAMN04515625_1928 [Methanohalophilus halophilus]
MSMTQPTPPNCTKQQSSLTFRELVYALTPYSISKFMVARKCGLNRQKTIPKNPNVAVYPPSMDINRVVEKELDKCVSFLPYCAKPLGENCCPLNTPSDGRKSQDCLKLNGKKCNIPCSLGKMIDVLKEHEFTSDRIFIIDSDSNLFPWLKQKKEEGYRYFMPGVGCPYGVNYALDHVEKDLGFTGCVIFIEDYDPSDPKNGVCRNPSDYLNMEYGDKGKKTQIPDNAIKLMSQIFDGSVFTKV